MAEKKAAAILLPDAKVALADAEKEAASVRADYEGAVQMERVGEGRTQPPRRAQKTRERSYGHRKLRVNQEG